jgi:hypothetical protein
MGKLDGLKIRYESYFRFTGSLQRSVRNGEIFTYPTDSLVSDLSVLMSCFAEAYEALEPTALASQIMSDRVMWRDLSGIVASDNTARGLWREEPTGWQCERIGPVPDAADAQKLDRLLATLRNGYAHFHWRYDNLSAKDYWNANDWSWQDAPMAFASRYGSPANYLCFVADAKPNPWDRKNRFWSGKDLRVLCTNYHLLRYQLHLFVGRLVGSQIDVHRTDVFGNRI